jgi:hypothetical protein
MNLFAVLGVITALALVLLNDYQIPTRLKTGSLRNDT